MGTCAPSWAGASEAARDVARGVVAARHVLSTFRSVRSRVSMS